MPDGLVQCAECEKSFFEEELGQCEDCGKFFCEDDFNDHFCDYDNLC